MNKLPFGYMFCLHLFTCVSELSFPCFPKDRKTRQKTLGFHFEDSSIDPRIKKFLYKGRSPVPICLFFL